MITRAQSVMDARSVTAMNTNLLSSLVYFLLIQGSKCMTIIKGSYGTAKPSPPATNIYPFSLKGVQVLHKFLQPRGFRIYFDDCRLVRVYLFANMNEPFNETHPESTEPQLFCTLTQPLGNFWWYKNLFIDFGPNDTLYFFYKPLSNDLKYELSPIYSISKYRH